ncbi:MAG: hypothetical protein M1321_01720 [Candidatus Marsarchaeota archaeon]|nr:hypothetical protein [Candidatus Marsarchaeota archaeon]
MDSGIGDDNEVIRRTSAVYLTVILRYRDYIESSEALYIPDLPRLIEPENVAVAALAERIKSSFDDYDYDRDFQDAAAKAYEYIKDYVSTIALPIQFWQKSNETLDNRAGDFFDKSVLFCSVLVALGCAGARVVLLLDGSREVAVCYELNGIVTAYKFDESRAERFVDTKSVASWLQKRAGKEDSQGYSFNNMSCINL